MRFYLIGLAVAAGVGISGAAMAQSESQIRQRIINQSISSFRGDCPCPQNFTWSGRRCGERAAYFRPGTRLVCRPADVTAAMMADYRNRRRN